MKIGIYGQFYHPNSEEYIQLLLTRLQKKTSRILIEENFMEMIRESKEISKNFPDFGTFTKLDSSYDLFISIGGDGTILKAITFVRDLGIPIVGINTGRLGFLATIQKEEMEKNLDAILDGDCYISERALLTVRTDPPHRDLEPLNFALNEVAVNRKNTTSMIKVATSVNGKHLTSYWSDGLLIATPTGSTGYSLSCGGPVIAPNANNFVITPIAPHNLNARPLVLPDSTTISLNVSGRENSFLLSLDSRVTTLTNSTTIHIKKAPFTIKFIQLGPDSFLNTLRKKLLWGEDKRN